MKAIVLKEIDSLPVYESNFPEPNIGSREVLVKVSYAALNRRDYWISKGMYPNIKLPVILGSDGAGRIGDRKVMIYPAYNWGESKRHQSDTFEVLGMPRNGTLAQYVAVPESCIFDQPAYLSDAEAAAMGLAGLTAYRAVFSRGEIRKGNNVLITGIGGGVALMAAQLAKAAGGHVYVTSGSDEKIQQAKKLGVVDGFNYKLENWHKEILKNNLLFDLIIDSAGGPKFGNLIKIAAPGGRIVTYGGTLGSMEKLNTQIIFWRQLSILGTTMGSPAEFNRLLNFASKHQIRPIIDKLYHWDSVDEAFVSMENSTQFGKIVFSLE